MSRILEAGLGGIVVDCGCVQDTAAGLDGIVVDCICVQDT